MVEEIWELGSGVRSAGTRSKGEAGQPPIWDCVEFLETAPPPRGKFGSFPWKSLDSRALLRSWAGDGDTSLAVGLLEPC